MPRPTPHLMDRVQTDDGLQGVITAIIETWPMEVIVALDETPQHPARSLRTSVENLTKVRKVEAVR